MLNYNNKIKIFVNNFSKWDKYFLDICNKVSENSSCFSRKVGAIIVRDNSIISTGYNGPPRGVPHCEARYENDENLMQEIKKIKKESFEKHTCPRRVLGFKSGEGLEWCIAGHAERNSIINAAREGISVKNTTMYMNCGIPCTPCLVEIINSGIYEIVVTDFDHYDLMSNWLLENSGLGIRKYNF